MLFKDPKLALRAFFGPFTPYQYRLEGPGKWEGAREACLTVMDRVDAPLNTRHVEPEPDVPNYGRYAITVLLLAIVFYWLFC